MAATKPVISSVLKNLQERYGGPDEFDEPQPLEQLILLLLSRGASIRRARSVMKRLQAEYVDWNEVRVTGVHELHGHVSLLGQRGMEGKAEALKELLESVYSRFNKLNLDFLMAATETADLTRKRERFQTYVETRSPALAAMLDMCGSRRQDVVIGAGLPRVLKDLGWLGGRSATQKHARDAIDRHVPPEGRAGVLWRLHLLAEEANQPSESLCVSCFVAAPCTRCKAKLARAQKGKATRAARDGTGGGSKAKKKPATRKKTRIRK